MIQKGNKIRFTMPKDVYDMTKDRNPNVKRVMDGVAVSDEYNSDGFIFVDVEIDGKETTLLAKDLTVIE
jgi:hypothetical protein